MIVYITDAHKSAMENSNLISTFAVNINRLWNYTNGAVLKASYAHFGTMLDAV